MSKMDLGEDFEETSVASEANSSSRLRIECGKNAVVDDDNTDVDSQFPDNLLNFPDPSECSEASRSAKRKINKELFPVSNKKINLETTVPEVQSLTPLPSSLRKLAVLDISYTKDRFAFEGKILNIYGTYDNSKNFRKFLKVDLTDEVGFGIVTLIFGPEQYKKFLEQIIVDTCVRVEGVVVRARNPTDGGSIDYSLHADATTTMQRIPFFETALFFVPEIRIQSFFAKVISNPNLKSTIAFVIVQVDNVQKSEGGVYEQLTIADGPHAVDRATLTFVNKRKALYYQLVDEFHRGNIVPYLARNIGAWKERSNTLSILDLTLVVPLYGDKRKHELEFAFTAQIRSLGYGKDIVGKLHITNFNGSLLVKKCVSCRGQNLNALSEGAFCFSCGKKVQVSEVVKLLGEIVNDNLCVEVTLSGEAVDKVLKLEKPLLILCKENVGLARVLLSEVVVEGAFVVDPQGQVIGFSPCNVVET